jgi:hypothetical protein
VRRGRSERYAFRGVCKSPPKGHGRYRINCNVSRHTPYTVTYYKRVSPLYLTLTGRSVTLTELVAFGCPWPSSVRVTCVQWKQL